MMPMTMAAWKYPIDQDVFSSGVTDDDGKTYWDKASDKSLQGAEQQ